MITPKKRKKRKEKWEAQPQIKVKEAQNAFNIHQLELNDRWILEATVLSCSPSIFISNQRHHAIEESYVKLKINTIKLQTLLNFCFLSFCIRIGIRWKWEMDVDFHFILLKKDIKHKQQHRFKLRRRWKHIHANGIDLIYCC